MSPLSWWEQKCNVASFFFKKFLLFQSLRFHYLKLIGFPQDQNNLFSNFLVFSPPQSPKFFTSHRFTSSLSFTEMLSSWKCNKDVGACREKNLCELWKFLCGGRKKIVVLIKFSSWGFLWKKLMREDKNYFYWLKIIFSCFMALFLPVIMFRHTFTGTIKILRLWKNINLQFKKRSGE